MGSLICGAALSVSGCRREAPDLQRVPLLILIEATEPRLDYELAGDAEVWLQDIARQLSTEGPALPISDARRRHVELELSSMALAFRVSLLEGLRSASDVVVMRIGRWRRATTWSSMELGRGLVARSNPRTTLREVGAHVLLSSKLTVEGDAFRATVSLTDDAGEIGSITHVFDSEDLPEAIGSVLNRVVALLERTGATESVSEFVRTLPATSKAMLWFARGVYLDPDESFPWMASLPGGLDDARTWFLDEAVRQDPSSSATWAARAQVFSARGDRRAALRAAARGYRLEPRSVATRSALGSALYREGFVAEAGASYGVALRIAPGVGQLSYDVVRRLGPLGCFDLGAVLGARVRARGDYTRLTRVFADRGLRLDPLEVSWEGFRRSLDLRRSPHDDAFLVFGEPPLPILDHGPAENDAMLGLWNGDLSAAEHREADRVLLETLAHVDSLNRGNSYVSWALASWAGLVGDTATSLTFLEQAHDQGFRWIDYVRGNPFLESVRESERYRNIEVRMEAEVAEMQTRYQALPEYVSDQDLSDLVRSCSIMNDPLAAERLEEVVDSVLALPAN